LIHEIVQLGGKIADGYVIGLGSVNLVNVVTDRGMVGCGAYDVSALDRHGYPAAKAKAVGKSSISTVSDLLEGQIVEVNSAAERLGVEVGMSGRQALDRL